MKTINEILDAFKKENELIDSSPNIIRINRSKNERAFVAIVQ